MKKELRNAREDYTQGTLDVMQVLKGPMDQFRLWFEEYKKLEVKDFNAMLLTTNKLDGAPTSRVVLLKELNSNGFDFFTNYNSNKAKEIDNDSRVSLNFFWPLMERQIRIEGEARKVSAEESDTYFNMRPRGSQIGAWVSPQSEIIESREFLENREIEFENKFKDSPVPRPEHWGGYRIYPRRVEFWQGRTSRLHDRIAYELNGNQWLINRLAP